MTGEKLIKRLQKYPEIRKKVEELLDLVEDPNHKYEKANAAEQALIDDLRKMGNHVMSAWAESKHDEKATQTEKDSSTKKYGKKLYWYSTFGTITFWEQLFLKDTKTLRPFSCSADVRCREYSLPLQRAITDFAAAIGSPDKVGDQLFDCAFNVGFGKQTYVHAVGDGASWIAQQVDRVFASQGSYLIDFSHLMGYLDPAAKRVYPSSHETWITEQKHKIKNDQISEVVQELEPHIEPDSVPRKEAPVRSFCCYVSNRPGQFEYKSALESNLPIGSGEIESAHRYVIQNRLKIAGAWWKKNNAQKMLALRVVRQNAQWEDYWEKQFSYLKAA